MSTFIHGVASCAAIDTAGEIVDIHGLDITSLSRQGVINYEHDTGKSPDNQQIIIRLPSQVVGKILKAKKIFGPKDCSNEHETYFWNKTKLPLVYIVAELFDDYCDSAKECAGKFKYSQAHPEQNSIFGFSVEGSEIPGTRKNTMMIMRSIARKVTLTCTPANRACIAEILENQPSQIKDEFEEIFKSEANAIEMFKSGKGIQIYETYLSKKEHDAIRPIKPPKNPSSEYDNQGIRAGKTKAGKNVYSHGHVAPYKYNPSEHQEQGEFHEHASVIAENPKLGDNKTGRMKGNANATAAGGRKEDRAALSLNNKDKISMEQSKQMSKHEKLCNKHRKLKKGDNLTSPDLGMPSTTDTGMVKPPKPPQPQDSTVIEEGVVMGKAEHPPGWSKGKTDLTNNAVHFNHPEHGDVSIVKQPEGNFHVKHKGRLAGIGGVKGSFGTTEEAGAHANKYMTGISNGTVSSPKMYNTSSTALVPKRMPPPKPIKKSLTAGGMNAAPSTLVNGSAYQVEHMASNKNDKDEHKFHGTKKKDWNQRAKEDYENWPHKDTFEKFMKARMPHLHEGEIRAIGRTLALKKNMDFEKSLHSLVSLNKSESVKKELEEKSLKDIQEETALKWCDRAIEAYKKAIDLKSVKWILDAIEYGHEAIEHSSLGEDLSVFEKIKEKLTPIHKKAIKLLVPESK